MTVILIIIAFYITGLAVTEIFVNIIKKQNTTDKNTHPEL